MLDVCLPGTGGSVPRLDRFLCCCYMRYNGIGLLIDCGEGTQLAVKNAGFSLGKIGMILITHFHADHISGLPGLLLSMGNEGHTEPLVIAGPSGIGEVVRALTIIAPELPFRVRTVEMGDFSTLEGHGFGITSFEVRHSCPCLGYDIRIERGGRFDRAKAEANGVPMKLWSRLQKGETVDGFTPDLVLGKRRRGLHVTYSTDTRPVGILATMAADADLLICEGMFERAKADRARESSHMTMAEAAGIAREAECRELWLTHYSPALTTPDDYAGEAMSIFPNTVIAHDAHTQTLRFEEE
ncbi:MAG: ribonuclease Z [Eubacteriales bacterium]